MTPTIGLSEYSEIAIVGGTTLELKPTGET